jgi:4-hydroxy-tetrahydrodipicolinate reductase
MPNQDPIRLLVLGTGHMGSGIAGVALNKPGLAVVGAYARRAERAGMDLGAAIGLDRALGVPVMTDLEEVIERTRPDVAIQATCSRLADAWVELAALISAGVPVISIAEEMAFPACASPDLAGELDDLAVRNGVAVLGTGINPGFVLDTLVIALSAVCTDVTAITATRVNDLSPFGPTVLAAQGVGLTPEAFRQGVADGSVVGHVGFPQSIHLIAAALGWDIERIEETREPIVAEARRETDAITVDPGRVAGCRHTATAYRDGEAVITLIHPQQIRPEAEGTETGDRIEIAGTPPVRLSGSPEIPGGKGTVALAINMIPAVLNAPPGLRTMAEVPVPSAKLADMRSYVSGEGRDDG